ncbi:MAG: hypothetical protein IKA22_00430, partial [Lentisphaeria bacterium]|nr:hypothetical protein [Lentisphaeria bacterium]
MSIAILRIKYFGVSNLPQNYADNSKQKRMQTGFDKRKNKKDSLDFQPELSKMSLLYQMVGVVELESTTSTMSTWRSNQLSY